MNPRLVGNFLIFQCGWFGCVLWGNAAVLPALAALTLHFALINERAREWLFVPVVALIGYGVDCLNTALDAVRFADGDVMAPLWLLCLWLLFATTLRHSLRWLLQKPLLAAAAGAVFGPTTYWAGVQLGAGELPQGPLFAVVLLLVQWPLLMLLFSHLQSRLQRHETL